MTLKEALETLRKDPVLLDDGADHWTVDNLVDALSDSDLAQEVYLREDSIDLPDPDGYAGNHLYGILKIGEEPYFVEHEDDGYRVKLMIEEPFDHSRYIYGQSRYTHKQAAYRRKSKLNLLWQQHRILGA